MDPPKRSVTIEARDDREVLRAAGTFAVTSIGYVQHLQIRVDGELTQPAVV
jgi:hypothetical protein